MDIRVEDNPARHRYEILVDGAVGGFADYRVRDQVVIITHSEIDPKYRGHGLGGHLAKGTLDTLRERGARVVPACPFFAKYVAEHPEYDDLVEV
jgi:uncharacterized protein